MYVREPEEARELSQMGLTSHKPTTSKQLPTRRGSVSTPIFYRRVTKKKKKKLNVLEDVFAISFFKKHFPNLN